MVLSQLLHQSSRTVAQCPVPEQPNDTDVTGIPEMRIVAGISCRFIGGSVVWVYITTTFSTLLYLLAGQDQSEHFLVWQVKLVPDSLTC